MSETKQTANKTAKGRRCAICGQPVDDRYRPFCSRRCADVDLHRWLGGVYAIPVDERPANDEPGEGGDGGR